MFTINQNVLASNNYSYTLHNLPKYNDNGIEIQYSVSAYDDILYDATSSGLTVTMASTMSTVVKSIQLAWDDDNNSHGVRPSTVSASLAGHSVSVTAAAGWLFTMSGLPTYQGREQVTYNWAISNIENYQLESKDVSGDVTTATFKYYVAPTPPVLE